MAKKNITRKALAIFLSVCMLVGAFAFTAMADGTTYEVGSIAYTADRNTQPAGEIPVNTKWTFVGMTDPTYDCGKTGHEHKYLLCYTAMLGLFCRKEEHSHDTCAIVEGPKAEWKLVVNNDKAIHLDIQIALTAKYTLNGTTYTANVDLTKEDYTSGRLTITSTGNLHSISDTGVYDEGQRRFYGDFPVGTADAPVYYTISLTKDVTFAVGESTVTVPMTFERTVSYWSPDNFCESLTQSDGYRNGSWAKGAFINDTGMDFQLGASVRVDNTDVPSETKATLSIQKDISGITFDTAKTFTFGVYGADAAKVATVNVTVPAGGTTAIAATALTVGQNYYVVEEGDYAVTGYELATSYSVNGATAVSGATTASFLLSNDTSVAFVNAYTEDKEEIVEPTYYTLTVNYLDEDGTVVATQETKQIEENAKYETVQKTVEKHTLKKVTGDESTGFMTGDKTVNYIYKKNPVYYTLIVNYQDIDGTDLAPQRITRGIEEGTEYSTEAVFVKGHELFTIDGDDPFGFMTGDKTVTYVYTEIVVDTVYYTLTVNYIDVNGVELASQEIRENVIAGAPYKTVQKNIPGFYLFTMSGDEASGFMTGDKTVNYVYAPVEVVDIPDEPVPQSDEPGDDEPVVDIPDDEVPLTDIPDEDVPETGDPVILVAGACVASLVGATGLALTRKRKEDEE